MEAHAKKRVEKFESGDCSTIRPNQPLPLGSIQVVFDSVSCASGKVERLSDTNFRITSRSGRNLRPKLSRGHSKRKLMRKSARTYFVGETVEPLGQTRHGRRDLQGFLISTPVRQEKWNDAQTGPGCCDKT